MNEGIKWRMKNYFASIVSTGDAHENKASSVSPPRLNYLINDIKEGKEYNKLTQNGQVLFMKRKDYDDERCKGLIGVGSRIEEKIFSKEDGSLKFTQKYYQQDFLGKGGFARVYKFLKESSNAQDIIHFATKVVDKKFLAQKNNQYKLVNEIQIHCSLNHKNIAKFYHTFEDEQHVFVLIELCVHNSLKNMLIRRGSLSEVEIKFFVL